MKQWLTLQAWTAFVAIAAGGQAGAQQLAAAQIPMAVQTTIHARFPGASTPEWKKKPDGAYEAEFVSAGVEIAAKFDSAGEWLETETTIRRSAVPVAVRQAISRRFAGYRIVETQSVVAVSDPRAVVYEIHLENVTTVWKVQFNSDGSVLNTSSTSRGSPRRDPTDR